jgi:uncharacterized membrane protein HdeD (DUF308 family)
VNMQPPPYPPAPGYDYEFDEAQNATIASAALWARVLGIVMLVVGVASLLNCNVITLIIDLVVGINLLGGASSLSMVVNMQALGKLGTAFKVRVIATIIGLVILFVIFAVVFVLAIASTASSR